MQACASADLEERYMQLKGHHLEDVAAENSLDDRIYGEEHHILPRLGNRRSISSRSHLKRYLVLLTNTGSFTQCPCDPTGSCTVLFDQFDLAAPSENGMPRSRLRDLSFRLNIATHEVNSLTRWGPAS